jgi:glycosyltransferase involved in cell wall biosynthesis
MLASFFFHGIIAVNFNLKKWAVKRLHCQHVIYLPNYTTIDSSVKKETILKGHQGKRVLCLANLRHQKNHFMLLEVAEKMKAIHPDWTFHLVGNDLNDDYSKKITLHIIEQSDITVLTSNSEGLPVALIEYGLLSKPTITTNVGEIPLIITNSLNGYVVPIKDAEAFFQKLLILVNDEALRMKMGQNLNATIKEQNSEEAVLQQYMNWIVNL